MRIALYLAAAVAVAVILVSLTRPRPAVGDPAPAFSAPATSGENVSLAGLKGQVVLLNFFSFT